MSGRSRFPFTASQWQELEHQALIFKYMASGIPIPPDLLFTIRRSSSMDSSLPPKLFPNHHPPQQVGWSCFQMGLGRKIDPEPGRCRRTDGKKWRCSKEAFPDSKYCERHMHRGKNRSRKPVEVLKSPAASTSALINSSSSPSTPIDSLSMTPQTPNSTPSDTQNRHNLPYPFYNNTYVLDPHHHQHHQPLVYHHHIRTHHGMMGLSSQDSNTSMLFDADLRNRYHVYGMKEEGGGSGDPGHAFFSEEPSGTVRGFSGSGNASSSMDQDSWQLTPVLTMSCSSSSSSSSKQHRSEHSYLQLQSGASLERKEETQKTIHFFDEWPVVKERDSSWPDLDDKSYNTGSVSTTHLSISIPSTNASYDFPIFSSSRTTTHNGG